MTRRAHTQHRPDLRVAVWGAGRWGALHATKLAGLPGVALGAIVDPHTGRGQALAASVGAAWLPDADGLEADAAVIAVPITHLADATTAALDAGLDVLVEKPAAASLDQIERVAERARRSARRLAVGYLERFVGLPQRARRGARLRTVREGPGAGPALLLDWLVHDLDHTARLLGPGLEVVQAIEARGRIEAQLQNARGRAHVCAGEGPRRRTLTLDDQAFSLLGGDPLGDELAAFCAWARGGSRDPRLATGADAAEVLRLVGAIRAVLRRDAA